MRVRRLLAAAVAVAVAALSVLASRADAAAGAAPGYVAADLAVGVALAGAALVAAGATAERLLVAGAGAAWLAGSVFAEVRSLHQGMLLVALVAFPDGRIRGPVRVSLVAAAAVVAFGLVPQVGVAALFATVAAVALLGAARLRGAFPAAAGGVLASALLYAWWSGRHDAPVPPLAVYEAALLTVAAGFAVATRLVRRDAARLADTALGGGLSAGLPGLREVLAGLIGDPGLRIEMWDPVAERFRDPATGGARPAEQRPAFPVRDGGALVAQVVTGSRAMADPPTAAAVGTAVALAVANHRLREAHERHVAELEAARRRLLAVTDRERDRAAQALRTGVIAALDKAAAELARRDSSGTGPQLAALLDEAATELGLAAADVRRIVGGAPPLALGEGRLRAAVEALAAASPVPVAVRVDPTLAADAAVETALFYVCSEALTNVAKHAGGGRAWIDLRCVSGHVVLDVGDDGCGAADPRGSGLQGLADRLAAVGGRLAVTSPPGGGTVVTATVGLTSGSPPARPAVPAQPLPR
ncbi:sensor histidine kinase [Phytohabitans sp. LJ34]|uniref:sensor histidine kinase n=1 Tax=Phytohabitans sp. LJ34 TaxID=3452217 RepID=UPI003F8A9B27